MTLDELVFALGFFGGILSLIFYVLFGQITVRRLRKNPETKGRLGVEFASGWDIFNVAQALSLPRFITRKLAESPMANFYANRDVLDKSTTVFDRGLANTFYWLLVLSIVLIFISSVV
jgi:hypothetical protein